MLTWPWADWDLVALDLDSGDEKTWPLAADKPFGVALHPEGRFAIACADGVLHVIDRASARCTPVDLVPDRGWGDCERSPVFSDDGSRLAFMHAAGSLAVASFDAELGELGASVHVAHGLSRPLAFAGDRIACERRGTALEVVAVSVCGAELEVLATYGAGRRPDRPEAESWPFAGEAADDAAAAGGESIRPPG